MVHDKRVVTMLCWVIQGRLKAPWRGPSTWRTDAQARRYQPGPRTSSITLPIGPGPSKPWQIASSVAAGLDPQGDCEPG